MKKPAFASVVVLAVTALVADPAISERSSSRHARPKAANAGSDRTEEKAAADSASGIDWNGLLKGLRTREDQIQSLAAAIDYEQKSKWGSNGDSRSYSVICIAHTDGRLWWDGEGRKRLLPGGEVAKRPGHKVLAYDGQTSKSLEYDASGRPISAKIAPHPVWYGVNPLEVARNPVDHRSLSEFLKARGGQIVSREVTDGRSVVVAESAPVKNDDGTEWKYRFRILPECDFAILSSVQLRKSAADSDWRENSELQASGFDQVDGIWLPKTFTKKLGSVLRLTGTVRQWQVNPKVPDRKFRLKFPPGIRVSDSRTTPPKSYRTPAANEGSAEEQDAPRQPIYDEKADAQTIISAALHRAKNRGKRVLIMFGGNWCAPCHLLHDKLQESDAVAPVVEENYELVLVDVGTLDKDESLAKEYGRDSIWEHGMPFLIVLDADGSCLVRQPTDVLSDEHGPGYDAAEVKLFLEKWAASDNR